MKRLTREHLIPLKARYKIFEPAIEVEPGETLVIETINHMTPIVWDEKDLHPHGSPEYKERQETGPIAIRGAKPGDCLAIRIDSIKILGLPHAPGGGFNGRTGYILQFYGKDRENYEQESERMASGNEKLDLTRSNEYGSRIINATEIGETTTIKGNVPNRGLMTNLPQGCSVEVPCYVDKHGINPCFVGNLPPQLAALNRMNISVQEMK